MLLLSLMQDDYFVIRDDIVLRVVDIGSARCQIGVYASPDIPVTRGAVLERNGGKRPACLANIARKKHKVAKDALFYWNNSRSQAVKALERLAEQLEGQGAVEEARTLRVQIAQILPKPWEADAREP